MKKLILALVVLVGVGATSQYNAKSTSKIQKNVREGNGIKKRETRKIRRYNSVVLEGSIDVILTDKSQNEIIVEAEEKFIPQVETSLRGSELLIRFKSGIFNYISSKKIIVYVPANGVKNLRLKGSGDIRNESGLSAPQFQITLEGSGDIKLKNLRAETTKIYLKGSGDIAITGYSKKVEAELRGSGDISAFGLMADEAKVILQGSGDMEISAHKSFLGQVLGSGDVKVKGNPKQKATNKKGSGSISFL